MTGLARVTEGKESESEIEAKGGEWLRRHILRSPFLLGGPPFFSPLAGTGAELCLEGKRETGRKDGTGKRVTMILR